MKLKVLHLYPELLNLYGDKGNIEVLKKRCLERSILFELKEVKYGDLLSYQDLKEVDFIFMGGGSDQNQKELFQDLLLTKKGFISDYINQGSVGLFICGAYQLLGNFYETFDGEKIEGLGIIDFYTKNEGDIHRSVGRIKTLLNPELSKKLFEKPSDKYLYGFENHGGHTHLGEGVMELGKVIYGHGNNRTSKKEGVWYKNTIGTYLHGPVLAMNPVFCDYLIRLALRDLNYKLVPFDDSLMEKARFYLE